MAPEGRVPYELSTFELPNGERCARLFWVGTITGEDADAALRQCEPGGSVYGLPVLALAHKMTGLSPEARAIFTSPRRNGFNEKMALVIANPVFRVMSNFVLRIRRNEMQQIFKSEAEAIAWLTQP
jgi:hypothetical protein